METIIKYSMLDHLNKCKLISRISASSCAMALRSSCQHVQLDGDPVQLEVNLQEQLSDHLNFRQQKNVDSVTQF